MSVVSSNSLVPLIVPFPNRQMFDFFFQYTAAVRSGILKCYRLFILIFPSVCRLLEQEKMSHNDLKQTWEMANVQFVENLKVQSEAFTRVWNVLTPDQRAAVQLKQGQQQEGQQERNRQPQVGHLIDLQSPQTSPQPTNDQVNTLDKKSIHVQSQKYSWAKKNIHLDFNYSVLRQGLHVKVSFLTDS